MLLKPPVPLPDPHAVTLDQPLVAVVLEGGAGEELQAAAVAVPPQYAQPNGPAPQDPAGVAVLAMPAQVPGPQGQQGYANLWDPVGLQQQAVTLQTQPPPSAPPPQQPQPYPTAAQPQAATIYYQGQPCQTIYSLPAPYPPTSTPLIQVWVPP